jgi:hypothetical protein
MYLRFAIARKDEESGRGVGIFHAARDLREDGDVEPWEASRLEEIRDWFNRHLERPDRFSSSKNAYYGKPSRGIAWFKDTATEHIENIREMISILERHGVIVNTFCTARIGYVVYEDDFQVVAEPFTDTIC